MGKLTGGPFGAVIGKVQNLVSYQLNGKNVVRGVGQTRKKPTKLQLASRQRFKVVNLFLSPIKSFIDLGFLFDIKGTNKNQHNLATSYNMKYALEGEYPDIHIDYSRVQVSSGSLRPAFAASVTKHGEDTIIAWGFDKTQDEKFRNDRAMILIYYPELNEATYFLSGAQRSEGSQVLKLPEYMKDEPTEFYISFLAEDRLSVSDSQWIAS